MLCPAERRSVPERVSDVEPRSAIDKQLHHREMIRRHCLMQGHGVAVQVLRIIAVRIFACVEQQPHYFHLSKLSRERECAMSIFAQGIG